MLLAFTVSLKLLQVCARLQRNAAHGGISLISAQQEGVIVHELVRRNLQVVGSWTFAHTAAGIVVRTMARAEVASGELSSVGDWHAPKVRADPNKHQPVRLQDTVFVLHRIAELGKVHTGSCSNLSVFAPADEHRLTAPHDNHVLAHVNLGNIYLDICNSHAVLGRLKVDDERKNVQPPPYEKEAPTTGDDEVDESASGRSTDRHPLVNLSIILNLVVYVFQRMDGCWEPRLCWHRVAKHP